MITADEAIFPNNVVDLCKTRFKLIDSDLTVLGRPLRPSDPQQAIGIMAQMWMPDEQSLEMRGIAPAEPTLQTYQVGIQAMVKHGDEETGLAIHSVLSGQIRWVLYRDQNFRVALQGLSATDSGVTESVRRWGVRAQRYLSNEIDSEWVYLSTLEFWIETENR